MAAFYLRAAITLLVMGVSVTEALSADTVFLNGSIYTLDASSRKVQALAVSNGTITFVGSNEGVSSLISPATTKVINLQGRMAMPGLIDSHMHVVSGGQFLTQCNFNYEPLTIDKVIEHVQKCVDAEPEKNTDRPGDWLEGVNLDYSALTQKSGLVTKADLDKVKTRRAISLRSSDYHTVFANSVALRLSRITKDTPDPQGGRIERLPGPAREPSGILQDSATNLLQGAPPPTPEQMVSNVKAALKLFREAGITTFQDAAARPPFAKIFETLQKSNELSARGYFDFHIEPPDAVNMNSADTIVREAVNTLKRFNDPSEISKSPILKWQAVKMFMDGVISYPASTGATLEPYFEPTNSSEWEVPKNATIVPPYWDTPLLNSMIEKLILNKIDVQLHADGDGAVRAVLDAVEAFRRKHPNVTDYRIGIAHDELTHPDDWPRFAKLGVDAIMSYQWAQPGPAWPLTFKSMGPKRTEFLEPYGHIAKFGRPIVYGSDWPIDPLDEFLALKTAVTRQGDPNSRASPAFHSPEYRNVTFPGNNKLSREAALRSITIEGARFLRADHKIGSLEVGKLADIIVLKRNYFEVPEEEIAQQQVLLTMLGGDVLYIAEGSNFGDIKPRFPNNHRQYRKFNDVNVGGFGGAIISEEAQQEMKLRRQSKCDHHH